MLVLGEYISPAHYCGRTWDDMKFSLRDPNTLIVAVYTKDGLSVARAKLRHVTGEIEDDVGEWHGRDSVELLAEVLDELRLVRARQVAVVTNDGEIKEFLAPPIRVPQEGTQVVQMGKSRRTVPAGGRDAHWTILHRLLGHEKWMVVAHDEFKELAEWHTMLMEQEKQ